MARKSLKSLRRSAERCSPIPPIELPQRLAALLRSFGFGSGADVAPARAVGQGGRR